MTECILYLLLVGLLTNTIFFFAQSQLGRKKKKKDFQIVFFCNHKPQCTLSVTEDLLTSNVELSFQKNVLMIAESDHCARPFPEHHKDSRLG